MPGGGTIDTLFVVGRTIEKGEEKRGNLYICFVDSYRISIRLTRWRNGWSVRFAVGRPGGHSPCRVILKDFKSGIHSLPAWRSAFSGGCGEQASKSLVVSLGKALNGTLPPLCGRQVA